MPNGNGKKVKHCRTCGQTYTGRYCRNRNCKQNQKSRAAHRANGSRPAPIRSGRTGWGTSSASAVTAPTPPSGNISVNGDALRELARARAQNGECPKCGFARCICASRTEISIARPFLEASDD